MSPDSHTHHMDSGYQDACSSCDYTRWNCEKQQNCIDHRGSRRDCEQTSNDVLTPSKHNYYSNILLITTIIHKYVVFCKLKT